MEAAEEEEQPELVGGTEGQADARGDEDTEADEVDEAAAEAVADGAPEHGADALEDQVHGDGLVEVVYCFTKGAGQGRDGWEVDVCRERTNGARVNHGHSRYLDIQTYL